MSKFKIGDKVEVISIQSEEPRGDCDVEVGKIGTVCEVTDYCDDEIPYLIDFGEDTTRWWFGEDNLKLYEEEVKQPTSYREMNPDSTVKVKIGDYEFDCPIKELLLLCKLSGCVSGKERPNTFWKELVKTLDFQNALRLKLGIFDVRFENVSDVYQEYFKFFYDKQNEKDVLLKDIEEQKAILKNQQEFLKELEDKYNSL